MDDTLQNLENELKRLPARRPSARFLAELHRELGASSFAAPLKTPPRVPQSRAWSWAAWTLLGAAAAVAILAFVQSSRNVTVPKAAPETAIASAQPTVSPEVAVNRYEPVRATSVLYDLKEEGLTTMPDQSEGRQLRYRYVDTYTWKNSTTNASLRWSVPRDEVRLVRANLD
jgi:hypothetical protein